MIIAVNSRAHRSDGLAKRRCKSLEKFILRFEDSLGFYSPVTGHFSDVLTQQRERVVGLVVQ